MITSSPFRLSHSLVSLAILIFSIEVTADSTCITASGAEKVECLRQQMCPDARSDKELAACFRDMASRLSANSIPASDPLPPPPAVTKEPVAASISSDTDTEPQSVPQPEPRISSVAPPESTMSPVSASPGSESSDDEFGLSPEPAKKARAKNAKSVEGQIVFLQKQGRGNYLIGLDNGQLWQENEPTRGRLKVGTQVKIIEGFMGSYKLFPSNGRSTGVNRLRCQGEEIDPRCAKLNDIPELKDS